MGNKRSLGISLTMRLGGEAWIRMRKEIKRNSRSMPGSDIWNLFKLPITANVLSRIFRPSAFGSNGGDCRIVVTDDLRLFVGLKKRVKDEEKGGGGMHTMCGKAQESVGRPRENSRQVLEHTFHLFSLWRIQALRIPATFDLTTSFAFGQFPIFFAPFSVPLYFHFSLLRRFFSLFAEERVRGEIFLVPKKGGTKKSNRAKKKTSSKRTRARIKSFRGLDEGCGLKFFFYLSRRGNIVGTAFFTDSYRTARIVIKCCNR